MDRLPMKDHAVRILPDQIVGHFHGARGTGLGVVLEHLAPAGNAGIGGDLDEHPGVLQDEGLNFGDFDVVVGTNRRRIGALAGE